MSRKLLDLGCGAGGAAWGYHLAGFDDITGVDINPQPRYPFNFVQANMLTFLLEGYDAIHLSAPCQFAALATLSQRKQGKVYPDLITPMRPRLEASGSLWVMENVPGAPLRGDLRLCGCHFGLEIPGVGELRRERWFETSWHGSGDLPEHRHALPAISIAGHGTPQWMRAKTGHVGVALWREIMGIGWTTRAELTEAVPPAYTEYVGKAILTELRRRADGRRKHSPQT